MVRAGGGALPGPYSTGLRRRVVAAVVERGERPDEAAARCAVGRSTGGLCHRQARASRWTSIASGCGSDVINPVAKHGIGGGCEERAWFG